VEQASSQATAPGKSSIPYLLPLARWLLVGLLLLTSVLTVAGLAMYPAYANDHLEELAPTMAWSPEATTAAMAELGGLPARVAVLRVVPMVVNLLVSGSMALLMLLRRGNSWFGLFAAFVFLLGAQGGGALKSLMGVVPGVSAWYDFVSPFSWQFFFIFLMVFPDGRFVPHWTRWTLIGWVIINLLPESMAGYMPIITVLPLPLVIIAVGSQIYRYFRQADAIQRQQTKWFVFALVLIFLVLLALALPNVFIEPPAEGSGAALLRSLIMRAITQAAPALMPLAVGIAIMRYRLWDIDIIVRRTLLYGGLTALLALVYLGSVLLLQTMFGRAVGEQSPIIIVLSTLLIAALFSPLRRRLQELIDRRFFRRKYDATQVLADFAETARDETDAGALSGELVHVVEETMRPERVSVWLKEGTR
jgi:hypothetical protein